MGNWCKFRVCRSVVVLGLAAVIGGCSSLAVPDLVTPVKRALEPIGRSFDTRTYVVQPGDNLAYIAWRYKASVDDLLAWNGMASASSLVPGQPLQVRPPRGGTVIAQAPARAVIVPAPQVAVAPVESTVTRAIESAPLEERLIVPVAPREDTLVDLPQDLNQPAAVPEPTIVVVEPVVEPVKPVVREAVPQPEPVQTAAVAVEDVVEVPTAARDGLSWAWPQKGKIVKTFQASDSSQQGIDIAASASEPIRAAADGIVAFAGSDVSVLGRTIIIDHAKEYLSAYAKVGTLLVGEGDSVRVGDPIAQAGDGGGTGQFHFQIRQKGVPLNPLKYLPKGN